MTVIFFVKYQTEQKQIFEKLLDGKFSFTPHNSEYI